VSRPLLPADRSSLVVSTPGPWTPKACVTWPLFATTKVTGPGLNDVLLKEMENSVSTALTVTACGFCVGVGLGVVVVGLGAVVVGLAAVVVGVEGVVALALVTTGFGLVVVTAGVLSGVRVGAALAVLVTAACVDMDMLAMVAMVLSGAVDVVLLTVVLVGKGSGAVATAATADALGWPAREGAALVAGAAVLLAPPQAATTPATTKPATTRPRDRVRDGRFKAVKAVLPFGP
jgi:hypothetical protein